MSLFLDTTYRSSETELMDDFSMKGDLLRDTLDKLGNINKWLGGNRIILRLVADYGRKHNYSFNLVGIDANQDAVDYATELSVDYPELSFRNEDVFSEAFQELDYDVVLTTLFLHHFKEEDIKTLLSNLSKKANLGIVVNDLQRSEIAYGLFKILGLVISNHMIKEDGLTSILRAFKREDLVHISKALNLKSQIHWKWAFRYQWLIRT